MLNRSRHVPTWLIILLTIALFIPTLILKLNAQTRDNSAADNKVQYSGHDPHEIALKKGWTHERRAQEAWLWHQLNLQRLERTHPLGAAAIEAEVINQDINDISVIDGNSLVLSQNLFDLGGRSVQFAPAGSGYTISSVAAAFDTNLGAKLNFTVPPAVNPKIPGVPGVEPGDDAYINQDLGFSFSFYGTSYSSVAVSSNGNLVFRPNNVSQGVFDSGAVDSGESLVTLQSGLPRIAPYWHDLDARASQTQGVRGIYLRRDSDRVVITWNNISDFPNNPVVDRGIHRFQATLFRDGLIVFTYDTVQLTSIALTGISPGNSNDIPSLVDLNAPPSTAFTNPIAEFFSTDTLVDIIGVAQAFYATHPNRDVYDFVYLLTDFDFNLGDAFAFYLPLRNDASGIGFPVGRSPIVDDINSQRIQGILNLSNVSQAYPDFPTTRFLGANHALSVMGQEQGHRWLAYVEYPGSDPTLLLGRDEAHWNFFLNIESTISSQAARRSSSLEGNVWRENGDGTFTSVNLIDGYSRLDQYLMGLRPPGDVSDTFVITNPTGTNRNRSSSPFPNVTVSGGKQNVTINQIVQANGTRVPDANTAPKSFRAAVVLLVKPGQQPSEATLNKVTRYRLAWESYFAQSTDYLGSINTGLADLTIARFIAAASAASYKPTLASGEIAALFGSGLTAGDSAAATSQPLPTILAGTQVLINGTPAPLFFAAPTQVNFQVPLMTAATTTNPPVNSSTALIEVISNGQLIRAGVFQIAPVVPAIFTENQTGAGPAAAVDAITGALPPFNATRADGQPNIISVFGNGLGADATDVDGNVNGSVQVTIDGNPVTVDYAGRAPGFTGLNQFNIVFPANITSGTHTLVISRNNIQSNTVTVAVR